MQYSQQKKDPASRAGGIVAVVLFHIVLGYALLNGLGKGVVEVIKGPLQTKIIEEVKPPEPENKPPPPMKVATPPPAFIPPVDIQVSVQQTTNAISVTSSAKPTQNVVVAPPEPPKAVVRTPARIDKSGCRLPEYPSAAKRAEEQGTVVLLFLVGPDGKVKESKVQSSSGSARLDEAARNALSLCRFTPGTVDGKAVADDEWTAFKYVWKLEDE